MTRERAKELLPIIQAYAEGKTIQDRHNPYGLGWEAWEDTDNPHFVNWAQYRIKPIWQVNKTYRHAGGKVCTILATDLRGSEPIVGRTYNNGGDSVNRFRADGTFGVSWGNHALDLTTEECEVPDPLPEAPTPPPGDIF